MTRLVPLHLLPIAVSRHLLPWVKVWEETTKEIRIIPKASVISREGNLKDGGHLRGACL